MMRHRALLVCRRVARRAPDAFANLAVYVTNSARGSFARCELTKPKILSTRPLFPAARVILDQHFEMDYWTPHERISRDELLKRVADKEGLICLLNEKVDEELLAAAPKLRIAQTVSVGFDNIDVAACTRRKVVATNTPGVLDDTTADFAWTRGRHLDAQRNLAGLGPRSVGRRRRVGQNLGRAGIRTNRARRSATGFGI
jgi:hypothetical protein